MGVGGCVGCVCVSVVRVCGEVGVVWVGVWCGCVRGEGCVVCVWVCGCVCMCWCVCESV